MLYLGYRTYKDKLATPETADPMSLRLGALFTHMNRKWYFDEVYDRIFVQPAKRFAVWVYNFIDRTVIDGILHWVARVTYSAGGVLRMFDRMIINGAADLLADFTKAFARGFRHIQTGQVQNYVFLALINALVLIIVYLALF